LPLSASYILISMASMFGPNEVARGWREPVGQVADECLSRDGRFLRDEEGAATLPTRDVPPAGGARTKLRARTTASPISRSWLAGSLADLNYWRFAIAGGSCRLSFALQTQQRWSM
jgi:hypothetical protein